MSYPTTGHEVYVSLNLSNTMLTGIGKGTITREEVSVSYLKRLFAEHGVIVSAKPEQRRLLEIVNERYDLELDIPETLKLFQLSEEQRRLVVVEVTGLRRKNGSLLPEYSEEEFNEATFAFVKYYVQGTHYDTLVEENKKLKFELEQELEQERAAELESELEQDEHPRDYAAELEDEEEEAALTSEKRLKREIRAEALRRLEEAARTESDFLTVVDEWNKLDRNRERRERDHENLRGDVPLEFQAVPDPKIAPLWMNLPRFRQLCQGNFLDIIFSCPYELHELTANRFLSKLFFTLSDEQKEVLYYLFVKQYSTARLAAIRGQSDRNIRKLRMTIQKKLQKRMYEHLSEKLENDQGLTLREREFVEEYEALLQTMGKDAVIRRENKTKPRKKKAALDDAKDG